MKPETTTTDNAVKKDIQKLQRAIVDGLEDVKAQDIQVFNTEHLSPLFERVVIASGTSNRQTKALAVSVRDAVREAGFAKPRTEGEDNGEWIIVDCGPAVVHVMQPAIRQYYHLEDLWGDKPVRLKHGTEKPVAKAAPKKSEEPRSSSKSTTSLKRSSAAKKGTAEAFPSKAQLQKTAAKSAGKKTASSKTSKTAVGKSPARKAAKPVPKAAPKVVKVNAPKPSGKSTAVKSAAAKKPSSTKPAAQRAQPAKSQASKAPVKKTVASKAPAKKSTASKGTARKG
ncbi:ribosome-associated protein IOJAP [Hylemonella gracilis str. Niagara R]|uniref:Ribosomal silencing factor RsfS n=1 Tax=Hylemonella gracilis str. Niagara R TaxID=1458275 RepID=A0A016XHE1_9BURK|nr:ribosome silencing factor [Hylemonella gracilis]EYC51504.1 ribosome-associated protein IOJAP [Hylemonella gracilis str. Niagara R]